jgi:hypothetical protein
MGQLAGMILLTVAGWWLFREGKRLGSRQGHGFARFLSGDVGKS